MSYLSRIEHRMSFINFEAVKNIPIETGFITRSLEIINESKQRLSHAMHVIISCEIKLAKKYLSDENIEMAVRYCRFALDHAIAEQDLRKMGQIYYVLAQVFTPSRLNDPNRCKQYIDFAIDCITNYINEEFSESESNLINQLHKSNDEFVYFEQLRHMATDLFFREKENRTELSDSQIVESASHLNIAKHVKPPLPDCQSEEEAPSVSNQYNQTGEGDRKGAKALREMKSLRQGSNNEPKQWVVKGRASEKVDSDNTSETTCHGLKN